MNIEVVTPDADPDRGGFGARVSMNLLMLSRMAEVRCLVTSWARHRDLPHVTFAASEPAASPFDRLGLLRTFYSTRPPSRPEWPVPDVLFVENLDLLAASRNLPGVPVILDEHNVNWELLRYDLLNRPFFQSGIGRRPSVQKALAPGLLRRATRFEERAIRRVDAVLVTSEHDRSLILARIPEAEPKTHVLPNCVDIPPHAPAPPANEPPSVLFAGNFNYVPNREAAAIIARELAPALPDTHFVLVGKDLPPELPLARNIAYAGHVDDLAPVLAAAGVCIAPLLQGSGTRIKILTYLAAGKAVVATTKACEGLDVQDERHLLIRDDWPGFVSGIQRLLTDPASRLSLGLEGRSLVEQRYDWRVQVPALRRIVDGIIRAGSQGHP